MNRVKNKSHPSRVSPLSTAGTASMVSIVVLWHPLWAIEESVWASSRDAFSLRIDYGVIHDHAGNAFAVRLLLGRVDTVSVRVHCQAVHLFLNRKVFQLAVVVGVVHLEYRDGSARTGHVDALQSGVELDHVGTGCHRQKGDGQVSVEIEDGHEVVPFAREEGAMMFWVESHPMIPFAASHRIAHYHFIRGRIDDRENILVLEVYVHFLGDGIVLRHSGFTVEVQRLHDIVRSDVHDGFRFAPFIRNVELVEWRSIGATVRLGFRGNFLDYFHLAKVHHANGVVAGVRRVCFLQFGNVLNAFGAWRVDYCGYDFVCA